MPRSEFELIAHYFAHGTAERDDVVLGIGDDAALLQVPPGVDVVTALETIAAGDEPVPADQAASLAHRCLAGALGRLAAAGAEPAWATLALTLPAAETLWLDCFSDGLASLAARHGIQLVGGDTTRGPLTVTIVALGTTRVSHQGGPGEKRGLTTTPPP